MRTLKQKQASLKGFADVKRRLSKEISAIENKSMAGLIDARNFIYEKTDKESPRVPVDTSNLTHSKIYTTYHRFGQPIAMIGFAANYALWVHEMVDADFTSPRTVYRNGKKKTYTPRTGAGPKFLETHLNRNHKQILKIISNNTKIK